MPSRKDLKRLIRARMQKTGESYTAARSRILERKSITPPESKFAELAGMSDEALMARTGRDWKRWVSTLDGLDAISMSHRDIAVMIQEKWNTPGWWAQTVTVGYERIRGLREVGQRRTTGKFDANKSKTFEVPVSRLYRAFSTKRTRERWLPDVELTIRTSTVDKSMRITWPDGTSVHAYFTAKGPEKSAVAIQHVGLPSKKKMEQSKAYWGERLSALGGVL